ncbi:MAG: GNAT family N-acetyltransferase [Anaerotignum sp.]|nr:GNAT family N-acetyltransferase [Anaerotignum sp.]
MIKKMIDGKAFWEEVVKRLSKGEKTNFFFSEKEVLLLVQKEKLTRVDFDGGVYFFVKEDTFHRIFYFLEKGKSPVCLPELTEPMILEEVLLAARERIPSEETWEKLGFMPYLERKRLFLMAKNVIPEERKPIFATEEMLDELFQFMHESFEPYSSALPEKEALQKDIQAQNILISVKDGKLLGFLHFGEEKQSSVLWHIAVKQQARGLGIGEGLVKDWFFTQKNTAKKFILWVRTDNPPALRMYEKLGFLPDGRVAPVMIKNI